MPPNEERNAYRGRFAPSPTGPLHLGSLFTAVASYLQARSKQGAWLVRIDDLDPTRCRPQYSAQILNTLEYFGLFWDEQVLYQSTRHYAYQAALTQLRQDGYLYACACSRKILKARLSNQNTEHYDGHCQGLQLPFDDHALRCRVDDQTTICEDRVQGHYSQKLADVTGDFIVYRRDQVSAYHLAVVVDDQAQGINEVFRGYDLLESTPRQLYLQRLLGIPTPSYVHIPILVDQQGNKLSKQTFADDVSKLQPAPTLIAMLNALQQSPPQDLGHESLSNILEWAITHWQFNRIPRVPKIATTALKALQ